MLRTTVSGAVEAKVSTERLASVVAFTFPALWPGVASVYVPGSNRSYRPVARSVRKHKDTRPEHDFIYLVICLRICYVTTEAQW